MKTLKVRNLPPEVADALERECRRRGTTLERTVVDLLAQGLGVQSIRSNGLGRRAGLWSDEEYDSFSAAIERLTEIDVELWT